MSACACGCGRPVSIAKYTNNRTGIRRGEPYTYLHGHHGRGRPRPDVSAARRNEKHPMWKGDQAKPASLHDWLNVHHPRSGVCEWCGVEARTEYANTNGHVYTRNRADYSELCVSCHKRMDWVERRTLLRASGWTRVGVSERGEHWAHPDVSGHVTLRAAWRRQTGGRS